MQKENTKNTNRVKELCERCLKDKWFAGSEKQVVSNCAFCDDARNKIVDIWLKHTKGQLTEHETISIEDCDYCLCPEEICAENGYKGYFFNCRTMDKGLIEIVNELDANKDKKIREDLLNKFSRALQNQLRVKDLPPEMLQHMIDLFKKHIEVKI